VIVAEVVRQRLDGRREIELPAAADTPVVEAIELGGRAEGRDDGVLPDSRLAPDRSVAGGEAVLIRLLPTGLEEEEYPLAAGSVTTIGRAGCDIDLPEASALADRHASISRAEEGYFLRDDGGAAGVFLRLPVARERVLESGDLLRIGRQFLRLSAAGEGLALRHFDAEGREVGRHQLAEGATILGRDAPGITLDPEDRTLSRRHLAVRRENGRVLAKDLKSVNGTFLRVRSSARLEHGDRFRLGRQDFLFSLAADEVVDAEGAAAAQPASPPASPPADVPVTAAGEPTARFEPAGRVVTVAPGQTLCEAAEAHGIEIVAECHSGICGSDPVRILSGREHLVAEPDDQECETLEDLCEREPGECRLACMVRVRGPVRVEIL
jgi:ferredoxin/pSer/pThr/pTyr-binding forkhead associated (FHA) protein